MPLFEFRCLACGSEFELLVRGGAAPSCPSCSATTLERLLSMFAVSSDGTQQRSRETLGAQQRVARARDRQEQSHYRHDHHDD